jgi:hypothetical protein
MTGETTTVFTMEFDNRRTVNMGIISCHREHSRNERSASRRAASPHLNFVRRRRRSNRWFLFLLLLTTPYCFIAADSQPPTNNDLGEASSSTDNEEEEAESSEDSEEGEDESYHEEDGYLPVDGVYNLDHPTKLRLLLQQVQPPNDETEMWNAHHVSILLVDFSHYDLAIAPGRNSSRLFPQRPGRNDTELNQTASVCQLEMERLRQRFYAAAQASVVVGLGENSTKLETVPLSDLVTFIHYDAGHEENPPTHPSSNKERRRRQRVQRYIRQEWGVSSFPQLVVIFHVNPSAEVEHDDNTPANPVFLLEFQGHADSAQKLAETIRHYYHRLVVTTSGVAVNNSTIDVSPWTFDNWTQVRAFWKDVDQFFYTHDVSLPSPLSAANGTQDLSHKAPSDDGPLGQLSNYFLSSSLSSTLWSDTEKTRIQQWWAWGDLKQRGDFYFFGQCRSLTDESPEQKAIFTAFEELSRVMANRRDLLFGFITDCEDRSRVTSSRVSCLDPASDGTVYAWRNPPPLDLPIESTLDDSCSAFDPTRVPSSESLTRELTRFLVRLATPPILWYDSYATAPIAFPQYRRVHLVLFVDAPDEKSEDVDNTGVYINGLRTACTNHKRTYYHQLDKYDMVCLVVPSSEIRILTTFGIDPWSPLDRHASELRQRILPVDNIDGASLRNDPVTDDLPPPLNVLPALLMTDQRSGAATHRYYLRTSELTSSKSPTAAIESFIADFWDGRLSASAKSSSPTENVPVNRAGIRRLTGSNVRSALIGSSGTTSVVVDESRAQHPVHSLVLFFVPTCGHCKRFRVLYNHLARLLRKLNWLDKLIRLFEMDISSEEWPPVGDDLLLRPFRNATIRWVPELYYISPVSISHRNASQQIAGTDVSIKQYDRLTKRGEGVGGLNKPLQILDWFFDVASTNGFLDDEQIQNLYDDIVHSGNV